MSWFCFCITGTRIRQMVFTLLGMLVRNLSLVNPSPPHWGTCVHRFTAQRVHLRFFAIGGDGEQESSFLVQYLSRQVKKGSKEALDKVVRTSSRHHEGVMRGMPLECSRPLIHLLSVGSSLDQCMPMRDSCHMSLYGIHSQSLGLGL